MSGGDAVNPRWLATADDLARTLIDTLPTIRFGLASTPAEVEAAYRLRALTVSEQGWGDAAGPSDGLERDEFDVGAEHVVAWDGGVLAGTLRLVYPEPGRLLPVEADYHLVVEPRGLVVGAGRLIVARPYREGSHRVLGGLAATAWLLMRRRGFAWAAGTATPDMLGLFRRLGFEVDVLGEARTYWGEERLPIRIGAADPGAWNGSGAESG